MAVNKAVLGSETLIDLTGDTATASDVTQGKTFHLADGTQATGAMVPATDRLIPFFNDQLTTLDLTGCDRIKAYMLYFKTNLTYVNAPDALFINDHGLYGCTSLTTGNFPLATTVGTWAMCNCGFTTINLPSISQVYAAAFNSCSSVTRITLGSGLTRIRTYDDGTQAPFLACNALEELVIQATSVPVLQNARLFDNSSADIGYNMTNFRGIFVPDAAVNDYKAASNWSAYSAYIYPMSDL